MEKRKPFIAGQQHIQGINRKRLSLVIISFLFILIMNTVFLSVSAGQEPLLVRVGAYANHPKIFMNANGKVSGFWPDLIEQIAKTENWKIEYVWGTWSEGLDHLINKKIAIMPDVAFTEKRNKLYTFSKTPVLMSWSRVYVNKETIGIESITDLKNKKIAALKGSVNLEGSDGLKEIALGFNLNCTFLEVDNYRKVFKAVEENRVDAGITNRNFGNKNAKYFKVKKTPIIFQPINMQFAFPKDVKLTPYLVKKINCHIKKLKEDEDSVYYQLLEKYFEAGIAKKTVEVFPAWLGTVLKSIIALFLFFILVIITSRIQIKRKTKELDIELKRHQKTAITLRKSEGNLRSIFEAANNIAFVKTDVCGKDSKIVEFSPGAEQIFGYRAEEIIGKPVAMLRISEDAGKISEVLKAINKKREAFRGESILVKKSGKKFPSFLTTYPVFNAKGKMTAVIGAAMDITEQKQIEKELEKHREHLEELVGKRTEELKEKTDKIEESGKALQKVNMEYAAANKELEEFAYIVSHDLKAPLRAISQLTHWISEDYSEAFDDDGKKQMDLILQRVKRMDGLIDGILRYSRVGRIREKEEHLDLNLLVNEVIENIAPPDNIQITFKNKLPVVLRDSIRMEQVFQNLIGNSIKFMDKNEGIIKVGCEDEGAYWKFSVSDNGPGIDKKYHDKIFQIFQTLTPRDEYESTGIGLTLVKKIIGLYGGSVWVKSGTGHGAAFFFTLPKERGEKHEKL